MSADALNVVTLGSDGPRVRTATNTRRAGYTLDQISELVGWRDLEGLVRYLRYLDPFTEQ